MIGLYFHTLQNQDSYASYSAQIFAVIFFKKFLTFLELLAWFKIVIFVFLRAISQRIFLTKEEEKNATIGLDVLIVNLQLLFYV